MSMPSPTAVRSLFVPPWPAVTMLIFANSFVHSPN